MNQQLKGKVLVVDDEQPVARLLQNILSREGYYARESTSFERTRSLLVEERFDLVTLDIMMPEVDGFEALHWMREHHPDTGVVMATAVEDLDSVIEAMRLGAYDYLLKPFEKKLISVQIARAMERQHLLAENRSYQRDLERKVEEQTRELQQAYSRLESKVRELEGRDRLLHVQLSSATLGQAYAEILQVLKEVLGVQRAAVYWADARGEHLRAVAGLGLSQPGRLEDAKQLAAIKAVPVNDQQALVARAFGARQPQSGAGREVAAPLLAPGGTLGVLWADDVLGEGEENADIFWALVREAGPALWAAQVTDDLGSGQVQVDELLDLE